MCSRNLNGGPKNPLVPQGELSFERIKSLLPPQFVAGLRNIYLCGNYGDPMLAKDTIQILEYFREMNPGITLGIHTNGSGRDRLWWRRLAGVVDYCRFGIDGLEDTNKIYRRHTSWSKIMASVKSFIDAGGNAEWDYIVFKHNEHQVEYARALAAALGFRAFSLKPTSRFFSAYEGAFSDRSPIDDRSGTRIGYLEAPKSPDFRSQASDELAEIAQRGEYLQYLNETKIICKASERKSLYLSAEGLVTPCCWLGSIYRTDRVLGLGTELIDLLPNGTKDIEGDRHGLRKIVEGPVFQDTIPSSWQCNSLEAGRLAHCARICGQIDAQTEQHAASRSKTRSAGLRPLM
jgi:hypothetical protein